MTITISDITDPTFLRLADDTVRQAYVDEGNARFEALCVKYRVDSSLIPDPAPYTPKAVAVACALIAMCGDMVGSDWREVSVGVSIDVYKAKLDVLQTRLSQLLEGFTPAMCGYEAEDVATSTATFTFARG